MVWESRPVRPANLDEFIRVGQGIETGAVMFLEFFGMSQGGGQPHGNVVGQVVAAHRQDEVVPQGVFGKDGQVGDPAAEVDEGHAQFLFFVGEDRFPGGQALQDDAVHFQAGPVGAPENIIERRDGPGDDVDLALQAHPVDAHRVLDAVLAVYQEFLHQGMDDFPVRGDGHGAGGIDDPVHVRRGHLAVLDGDDALAV